MDERIKMYWTKRAHDFSLVRRNELQNNMYERWQNEISKFLPDHKPLKVLDIGTGTGFFAILIAEQGHKVTGVDITPAMIEEARELAGERKLDICFEIMDAQNLDFPNESFDAVISRNLTWTLPDPGRAYAEWLRVLKPGGVLLNFDADYGEHERSQSRQNRSVPADSPYGHLGMTRELEKENAEITLSMHISNEKRPMWDVNRLTALGIKDYICDTELGRRVLGEFDLADAPMFMVCATK